MTLAWGDSCLCVFGVCPLPDHRLWYGFQTGRDLDPLLPLLSPRVREHVEVVWAELSRVRQLHGRDEVGTKYLHRQQGGTRRGEESEVWWNVKINKTAKIYVHTLVLGCSRAKFCSEDDAFLLLCYFNLHIGSIGNHVWLDKTRAEHDKVSLPDERKKLGIAIQYHLHAVSINMIINSDCSWVSHYR